MQDTSVINHIKQMAMQIMPKGAKVILFGSRARGTAREDSDWDVLVLLKKEKITSIDHDKYTYPFWELGWQLNAMIHPIIYTVKDWQTRNNPIFRENIEKEGIVLC